MKRQIRLLVALVGMVALFTIPACKTVEGAGEDISNLGKGISNTSQEIQNGK